MKIHHDDQEFSTPCIYYEIRYITGPERIKISIDEQ